MYRYEMLIDGKQFITFFEDHFEAADFMDEVEREDGSEIIVLGYYEVTAQDILNDPELTHADRIEYAAIMLLPNHRDFKKWSEQEAELKRLGYIA